MQIHIDGDILRNYRYQTLPNLNRTISLVRLELLF